MTAVESLDRLAGCAGRLGEGELAQQALDLAERVAGNRYYVACLGQFKRGKSTLLDALTGVRLLPAGVAPVTAVPTVLRYGSQPRARVRRLSGMWEEIAPEAIRDYVSQECNPDNHEGVAGVEVFTPSPLLAQGMCLVDTPGLGSVFQANSEAARAFLPHVDAALVIFGADPPLTGAELAQATEVAQHTRELIFVLNKMDRCTAEERAAASTFSRQVLESRLRRPIGPIHEVSALQQLEGSTADSPGWAGLAAALQQLDRVAGNRLAAGAAERGVKRIRGQLLRVLEQEREALRLPVREARERAEELRRTGESVQRSRADLAALLLLEKQQVVRQFDMERQQFLRTARTRVRADLAVRLRALPRAGGPSFRRAAMAAAQDAARQPLLPWLAEQQQRAEAVFHAALGRFTGMALDFLRRCPGMPPELATGGLEAALNEPSHFTFAEFLTRADPASPLRYAADCILGALHLWHLVEADAVRFLDLLLETNARRVQSDLEQRVAASSQRLQQEISRLLTQLAAATERACARALAAHAQGVAAAASRLQALDTLASEIESAAAVLRSVRSGTSACASIPQP